ncbi:MAG: hypothetical protein LBR43_00485 [Spiroplasmataceae bacterium]|nr:hypothetical protein [Spiroplasmataceae bacterium]
MESENIGNKLNPAIVNEIDELIGQIIRTQTENQKKEEFQKVANFINTQERFKFNNNQVTEYKWTTEEEINWAYDLLMRISEMF